MTNTQNDNDRYQTVYSQIEGSVAAPTAGLHFTKDIFDKLKAEGIQATFLTLHVGAGTFLPVKTENIHEHKMHTEYCSITPDTAEIINKAKQEGKRIIAVGTTTLRTLESACNNGIVKAGSFETDIFITPGLNFKQPICYLLISIFLNLLYLCLYVLLPALKRCMNYINML